MSLYVVCRRKNAGAVGGGEAEEEQSDAEDESVWHCLLRRWLHLPLGGDALQPWSLQGSCYVRFAPLSSFTKGRLKSLLQSMNTTDRIRNALLILSRSSKDQGPSAALLQRLAADAVRFKLPNDSVTRNNDNHERDLNSATLRDVLRGGDGSFSLLVVRHRERMVLWAKRYLPDAEAEDAVQNAFITLLSKVRKFNPDLSLRDVIAAILRYEISIFLRARSRYQEEEGTTDILVDPRSDPELAFLNKRSTKTIAEALFSACSRREQQAILFALDGAKDNDVAKVLGISVKALRAVRHRARKKLAKALETPTLGGSGHYAILPESVLGEFGAQDIYHRSLSDRRAGPEIALGEADAQDGLLQPRRRAGDLEISFNEIDAQEVENRLMEFENLEQGWLDGNEGKVPPKEGLAWLHWIILKLMVSYRLPAPYLYPTPEGGVQAEWSFTPWEVSAEFNLTELAVYLHAVKGQTHETMVADVNFRDSERKALEESAGFILGIQKRREQA